MGLTWPSQVQLQVISVLWSLHQKIYGSSCLKVWERFNTATRIWIIFRMNLDISRPLSLWRTPQSLNMQVSRNLCFSHVVTNSLSSHFKRLLMFFSNKLSTNGKKTWVFLGISRNMKVCSVLPPKKLRILHIFQPNDSSSLTGCLILFKKH